MVVSALPEHKLQARDRPPAALGAGALPVPGRGALVADEGRGAGPGRPEPVLRGRGRDRGPYRLWLELGRVRAGSFHGAGRLDECDGHSEILRDAEPDEDAGAARRGGAAEADQAGAGAARKVW